jgi:sugar lactone lactonase YvrE
LLIRTCQLSRDFGATLKSLASWAVIWVANQGGNSVTLLTRDGVIIGTYSVGTIPTGICFDGNAVWIANKASNNLLRR